MSATSKDSIGPGAALKRVLRVRWGTLGLLLVGHVAWAGWTIPSGTDGSPVDVTVVDAGHLVVVTTTGAYELTGAPVPPRQLSASSLRSGFVDGAGCFGVIDSSGFLGSIGNCGYGFRINQLNVDVQRLRISSGGHAWACSRDVTGNLYAHSGTAGTTQPSWVGMASAGSCAAPLSALSTPSGEYALFTVTGASHNLALYRDGALEATASTNSGVGLAPSSVQLVGGVGVPLRAFAVTSTGGLEVAAVDGGVQAFSSIPIPPGVARFHAVALHQTATERFGVGLVQLNDGNLRVFSAVPDPSPASFGREWRENTAPPATSAAAWKDVQCLGAAACGATSNGAGTGSVFAYVNSSAPSAPVLSSATVPAGGTVPIPVTATDPDGDAVWLSWRQTSPASPTLAVAAVDGGTSLTVSAPSGTSCEGSVPFTLEVQAEDGRAGHLSAPSQLAITVQGTPPAVGAIDGVPLPAWCEASAGQPIVVAAGDLTHAPPPDACPTQTIRWSQVGGPPALSGTAEGNTVSLRAEGARWDDLIGRPVRLELVASSGAASSASVVKDVAIAPLSPFVRAAIATDAPIVSEIGAVGVTVTLVNESACGVSGATVVAYLGAARLVEGTLRLDGVPADGAGMADGVRVAQLDLPPGVPRVFRFDVRPGLLGALSPRAVAMIGDVPVSEEVGLGESPEMAGCGCTSGSGALAAWGLLAAAAWWGRRQTPKKIRRCRGVLSRRSSTRRSSSNP